MNGRRLGSRDVWRENRHVVRATKQQPIQVGQLMSILRRMKPTDLVLCAGTFAVYARAYPQRGLVTIDDQEPE